MDVDKMLDAAQTESTQWPRAWQAGDVYRITRTDMTITYDDRLVVRLQRARKLTRRRRKMLRAARRARA
jgi:hypothetical protein